MKDSPKVAILILHYGSKETTTSCLDNLSHLNYSNFHILLLDNDPQNRLHLKKSDQLTYIKSKENLGYAKGVEELISVAQNQLNPDYFLLLNNDTTVDQKLLTELIEEISPKAAAISPLITYADNQDRIWFAGGYFNQTFCYTTHPHMDQNLSNFPTSNKPIASDWLTGCTMLIKAKAVEKIGSFDPQFYAYAEDVDWSLRARGAGYNLELLPKPLVTHHVSSSFGTKNSNDLTPTRAYYYARNNFLLIKKHYKGLQKLPAILGQFFIRLPYFTLNMLLTGQHKAIPHYLRGLHHGIKFI